MEGYANGRVYVEVDVSFDTDGCMTPRYIFWRDEMKWKRYKIDRISEIVPVPIPPSGVRDDPPAMERGDRYTVWIGNQPRFLFFERFADMRGICHGRWFVNRRSL